MSPPPTEQPQTGQEAAVIVGAGPGLGSALARRFASAGMKVAVARREAGALAALAGEIGGLALTCDATDEASVRSLFETVRARLGVPVVTVFNAGAYSPGAVLDIDPAEFERCWRVGCLGGLLVGQAAGRLMVERGRGTLLFTGATASLRGGARFLNLAVGKFGLRAVAQSMARDLGPRGVHVAHVIIDGQIAADREGYRPADRGDDAVLSPQAVAEAYYQLHLQARSAWTQELDLRPWVEKF